MVAAIDSLVHQSLLSVVEPASGDTGTSATRVVMLETVREFALERLAASGEAAEVQTAHALWYLALAEASDATYRSRSGHGQFLVRLQAEFANVRAAFSWWQTAGENELNLQLAGTLAGFWYFRDHFTEGRTWLTQALDRLPGGAPAMRARALQCCGQLAHYQGGRP